MTNALIVTTPMTETPVTVEPVKAPKSEFAGLEFDYLYECWQGAVNRNDFGLVRKLYVELSVRPEWSPYNANQAKMA
jgi:hypothetical protein